MSKYVRKFWFEGQLALSLGVLLLLAAVALAVDPIPGGSNAWPVDQGGATYNNCKCISSGTDCTYALNTCYVTADTDQGLVAHGPHFKTTQMRSHGTCSGYYYAGDQCTQYPQFTCAVISFYNFAGCVGHKKSLYIVIGPGICSPDA